jgi:hypothetical protein
MAALALSRFIGSLLFGVGDALLDRPIGWFL